MEREALSPFVLVFNQPTVFFKIHFNSVFSSACCSYKRFVCLSFSHQNCMHFSSFPCVLRVPSTLKYIWRGVQILKLRITWFSGASGVFLPFCVQLLLWSGNTLWCCGTSNVSHWKCVRASDGVFKVHALLCRSKLELQPCIRGNFSYTLATRVV